MDLQDTQLTLRAESYPQTSDDHINGSTIIEAAAEEGVHDQPIESIDLPFLPIL